jgi:cytochrome b561
MRLRNGEHGYGLGTKLLHWLTLAAIVAQFVVGWTMSDDHEGVDRADDRLGRLEERFEAELSRLEEQAEAQGDAAEERFEEQADRLREQFEADQDAVAVRFDDDDEVVSAAFPDVVSLDFLGGGISAPEWHVLLGLSLIGLGLVRLLWRRTTPLPPWAEHLGAGERRLESRLEKLLLTMLLVVPATGLLLVAGAEDWLPVHVTAQIVFLAVIAAHLALVLKHTVVRRNRHLARLL